MNLDFKITGVVITINRIINKPFLLLSRGWPISGWKVGPILSWEGVGPSFSWEGVGLVSRGEGVGVGQAPIHEERTEKAQPKRGGGDGQARPKRKGRRGPGPTQE